MKFIRKVIYDPTINYAITRALKPVSNILPEKFKIPVVGTIKVKVKDDIFINMATNQTNCLTKDVFWHGIEGYEYASIKIFIDLVKDMKCLFDVGANIGYYSLIAGAINKDIKCYAFEPMPAALHFLNQNISLNNLESQITTVPKAISDQVGEVEFFVTKNPKADWLEHHIGGSSSSARAKDKHSQTIKVKTETLDNYVSSNNIQQIDFLKLDTEATEDLALKGAKNLLKLKPIIMCEVLPGRIEKKLQSIFTEHEYRFFLPTLQGLVEVSALDNIPNNEKDLFFIPKEKQNIIDRFIKN